MSYIYKSDKCLIIMIRLFQITEIYVGTCHTSMMELFREYIFAKQLQHRFWQITSLGELSSDKTAFSQNFSQWTLSWFRSLFYRNQSIDLLCKSMGWFLYDRDRVMKELMTATNRWILPIHSCYWLLEKTQALFNDFTYERRNKKLWKQQQKWK